MSFDETSEHRGYLLGIAEGVKMAANILLESATNSFRAGNDDRATLIRDESRVLRKIAEERRVDFEKYKQEEA